MTTNPLRAMPAEALHVVRTWATWRAMRVWPDAGGLNDQSAWMMDAFGMLTAAVEDKERR